MDLAAHRTTYYHAKTGWAAGQAFGPFRTMTDSQSGDVPRASQGLDDFVYWIIPVLIRRARRAFS